MIEQNHSVEDNHIKFLKNWTLPIAIVIGIILYFIFHLVPFLSPIAKWYAPYNGNVLPDFMFLILFVIFCKVDFRKLLPVKWHFWICLQQILFVFSLVGVIVAFKLHNEALIMLEAILVCIIGPCAAATAVKCLDITWNTNCEGRLLTIY